MVYGKGKKGCFPSSYILLKMIANRNHVVFLWTCKKTRPHRRWYVWHFSRHCLAVPSCSSLMLWQERDSNMQCLFFLSSPSSFFFVSMGRPQTTLNVLTATYWFRVYRCSLLKPMKAIWFKLFSSIYCFNFIIADKWQTLYTFTIIRPIHCLTWKLSAYLCLFTYLTDQLNISVIFL